MSVVVLEYFNNSLGALVKKRVLTPAGETTCSTDCFWLTSRHFCRDRTNETSSSSGRDCCSDDKFHRLSQGSVVTVGVGMNMVIWQVEIYWFLLFS